MPDELLGRVATLLRYPVKSMAAESLDAVDVQVNGLAGDRRWAFVRPGVEASNFPWMTIRQRADMGSFVPHFADPERPDHSPTLVAFPGGGDPLDVTDPALAAELGEGVRVIKQNRGVFDWLPISLITAATVDALGELVGSELDVLRFRPNLVIDTGTEAPFAEDAWVGATLALGDARIRIDERDTRCALVNVDPATSERDPAVLKAIAKHREACLGVYGSVVTPGAVRVGDALTLVDAP